MNQASLGLIDKGSVKKMVDFLKNYGQHGNALISDIEEIELLSPIKKKAAKLFNCKPHNIAILSSASEFLSQIPYMLRRPNGGTIILVDSDFPSLIRPWYGAKKNGKDYQIKFAKDDRNLSLTEEIIKLVDSKTAAVVVSHVQFSTGTRIDIKRVKKAVEQVGALFILDITQSAGVLSFNDQTFAADALVSSGYKWLGGHGGIALAILSEKFLEFDPLATGWMSDPEPFSMDTGNLNFSLSASKYTQSTISYMTVKGLESSFDQILNLTTDAISTHAKAMANILFESIEKSGWFLFRSINDYESSPHILTIAKKNSDVTHIYENLRSEGIITSLRNGRIRISIAHYNSANDLDKLSGIVAKG